jgi:hypothetical protein
MIEIKKKTTTGSGTQLTTVVYDLMGLSVNFTNLFTTPFVLINAIPNKIIQPLMMNFSYYSVGVQSGAFYFSNSATSLNTTNALFCWLSGGVVPDQSGSISYQFYGTAPFSNGNNPANENLELWTNNNEILAGYNKAILTITYFTIDEQ